MHDTAYLSVMCCKEHIARQTDYRLRVKRIRHWLRMDLGLFVLWELWLVVGTFLLSSETQNSKYGTKQLPTELYAQANGEGGK